MVISKIRTEKDSNLHKIKEVTKATKPQPTSKHLDTKILVHRMNTYPNGWGGGGYSQREKWRREKWSKAATESILGKIMGMEMDVREERTQHTNLI